MAAMAMKAHDSISVSVPTKLGQGQGQGDQAETTRNRYLVGFGFGSSQHQHQQDDAFSRYSNDFVRMKSLLLSSREEDDHGNEDDDLDALASINRALSSAGISSISQLNRDKRRRGNNASCIKQGHERKTRLSWELHPSLILHDFIEELEALDNGAHLISDTGDEDVEGEESSDGEAKTKRPSS